MTFPHCDLKPHIGAVVDVPRSALMDQAVADHCLELLDERVVLVFPGIGLSDEEHLAFTDLMGERIRFTKTVGPGVNPDIYEVTLDPAINSHPEYVLGTFFWHMDGITSHIPPPKASLLSAHKISAKGGQTEFANCFAAYDHLPTAEKAELDGVRVVHSVYASVRPALEFHVRPQDWDGAQRSTTHPLVWTHPTGRKSLLIGSHAEQVVDMPLAEGRALLTRLLEWTAQPDFTYRHQWSEGDLVVWNNCGGLHRVIPYSASSGRKMHRTSLAGTDRVI